MHGGLHGRFTGDDSIGCLRAGLERGLGDIACCLGAVEIDVEGDDIGIAQNGGDGEIDADISILDIGGVDRIIALIGDKRADKGDVFSSK